MKSSLMMTDRSVRYLNAYLWDGAEPTHFRARLCCSANER
jgi:hypothetical protein